MKASSSGAVNQQRSAYLALAATGEEFLGKDEGKEKDEEDEWAAVAFPRPPVLLLLLLDKSKRTLVSRKPITGAERLRRLLLLWLLLSFPSCWLCDFVDRTDTLTLEECELSSPSYTSKRVGSSRDKGPLREFEGVPFEGRLFFSTAESEGMLLLMMMLMIMMMMEDTLE